VCVKQKKKSNCKGSTTTDPLKKEVKCSINHPSSTEEVKLIKAVSDMKMEAKLHIETPSRIFATGVRKLDKVVVDIMPVEDNVKRTLRRARQSRHPTMPQNTDSLRF